MPSPTRAPSATIAREPIGLLLVEEAGGVASNFLADAGLTVPGPAFAGTPALQTALEDITGLKAAVRD